MANQRHFLLVTIAAQGHINPTRHLARRLVRTTTARVTITVPIDGHRRMFPSSAETPTTELEETEENGLISYIPYSDGAEHGLNRGTEFAESKRRSTESLTALIADLAAAGRPVTCVVYALFLTMAADVAAAFAIPSVLFWIQPAAVFAVYYHHFHGFSHLISGQENTPSYSVELPHLPPLRMRDVPSFLIGGDAGGDGPYPHVFGLFRDVFRILDQEVEAHGKIEVLVNTFQELEADVLSSIADISMIAVGPLVPPSLTDHSAKNSSTATDLFKDDGRGYVEWLDSMKEKSVVFVSFGSLWDLSEKQAAEIRKGLKESGRPYLWVLRKDSLEEEEGGEEGMVVRWCSQGEVLSHPAVGCFVTHCGWNSMLESMVCGVPMVMAPQWTDQTTNARMAEGVWGIGVRVEVGDGGMVEGEELKRCLEVVMGDGEKGREIREGVKVWRDKARGAVREGGSSVWNLEEFVQRGL